MTVGGDSGRGHRVRHHTADVIIEAWGDDLATCVEEAVMALIRTCFDVNDVEPAAGGRVHAADLPVAPPESVLLGALDEVIFVLDTSVDVPVGARVTVDPSSGHHVLSLVLADRSLVEPIGAGPKAISRSGLSVQVFAGAARCTFLVDV